MPLTPPLSESPTGPCKTRNWDRRGGANAPRCTWGRWTATVSSGHHGPAACSFSRWISFFWVKARGLSLNFQLCQNGKGGINVAGPTNAGLVIEVGAAMGDQALAGLIT